MALIKNTRTKYGVEADYWRIETVTIDKRLSEGSIVIYLYLSPEAEEPLDYRVITIADRSDKEDLFDRYFSSRTEHSNILESCYNLVKEVDTFFIDAVDDLSDRE